jgi:hypothetical protein
LRVVVAVVALDGQAAVVVRVDSGQMSVGLRYRLQAAPHIP